jgi:hypothetical protein
MKSTPKPRFLTSRALTIISLALAAPGLAAGCASPSPSDEANDSAPALSGEADVVAVEQEIRRAPIGDRLGPSGRPAGFQALKMTECAHFRGTITVDNTCPETSAQSGGATLIGRFKCTIGGRSLCIDENVTE